MPSPQPQPQSRYDPNVACANLVAADNEEIVQSCFQHLRDKDIDGRKALWAEDNVYQIPYDDESASYDMPVQRDGTVTTIRGRDDIAACFSVIPRHVEHVDLTDVEIGQTLDPALLYVEFRLAFLIAKTRFLYRNIGIGRMRIEHGRITLFREYLDLAQRKKGWAGVFFFRERTCRS